MENDDRIDERQQSGQGMAKKNRHRTSRSRGAVKKVGPGREDQGIDAVHARDPIHPLSQGLQMRQSTRRGIAEENAHCEIVAPGDVEVLAVGGDDGKARAVKPVDAALVVKDRLDKCQAAGKRIAGENSNRITLKAIETVARGLLESKPKRKDVMDLFNDVSKGLKRDSDRARHRGRRFRRRSRKGR